jgi:hypothetical protein
LSNSPLSFIYLKEEENLNAGGFYQRQKINYLTKNDQLYHYRTARLHSGDSQRLALVQPLKPFQV